METNRLLRMLIYLFSGLIVLFLLLMAVNYIGSMAGRGEDLRRGAEEASKSASARADAALAAAAQSGGARASLVPGYRQGLSTASVRAEGAINLVKENDFDGVAEKPKSMMEVLDELSGGDKSKPQPVKLKDRDLDKKIKVEGDPGKEPRVKGVAMPELGRGPGQEGVTLLSAPVDYKLFRSSETWTAFTAKRKCRAESGASAGFRPSVSSFAAPDFSRDSVVVLVSVSDLPSGIFKIVKAEKAGREIVVSYRVDPLAMSAGSPTPQHDVYSGTVIPAGLKVRLAQVP